MRGKEWTMREMKPEFISDKSGGLLYHREGWILKPMVSRLNIDH